MMGEFDTELLDPPVTSDVGLRYVRTDVASIALRDDLALRFGAFRAMSRPDPSSTSPATRTRRSPVRCGNTAATEPATISGFDSVTR